jgi:hypothetical protein
MKKLPLGIQTFSEIIKDDYLYVDKTKEILSLIESGKYYFLSRPRRFGKSLLISTLKEIFSGNKGLFKGLHIYDKWNWKNYPVIHIDFSKITHNTTENLEKSIHNFLNARGDEEGLTYKTDIIGDKFQELIKHLYSQGPVVILVDEYDKPIINTLPDKKTAKNNRDLLRNLFDPLKGMDPYLKFVFLTGVSKFSKVSIFSGLNNLTDITLSRHFTQILGISAEELTSCFSPYIEGLSKKQQIPEKELINEIQHWYNGYSWDGINKLYNPTSILKLFFEYQFENWWFATGTPTFLIKLIKENSYPLSELEETRVSGIVLDSYEIDNIDINALLLQTGYLTVKKILKRRGPGGKMKPIYILGCPNHEVKEAFLNYLVADYTNQGVSKIDPMLFDMLDALEEKNIDIFLTILKSLFARIPSHLHLKHEFYYHSLFYMILALMGAKIQLELLSDKGQVDGIIELKNRVYIIEFKMGSPEKGMAQIKTKKYHESFLYRKKEIILFAIGGFEKKDIKGLWEIV